MKLRWRAAEVGLVPTLVLLVGCLDEGCSDGYKASQFDQVKCFQCPAGPIERLPVTLRPECADRVVGPARLEGAHKPLAAHLGGDSSNESDGVGAALGFDVEFPNAVTGARFWLSYADDVAGNVVELDLDGQSVGSVPTGFTGGWSRFADVEVNAQAPSSVARGEHELTIRLVVGGSYGVMIRGLTVNE